MEDCTSKKVGDIRVSVVGNSVMVVFKNEDLAQSFSDVVVDILDKCESIVNILSVMSFPKVNKD